MLLARIEHDLVPHGVGAVRGTRRPARGLRRRLAFGVEVDPAAAAAERLLLAGRPVERWVQVLGAVLVREEHELLRADALGVHERDELEAVVLEVGEAEVCDLDPAPLRLE